MKIALSALSFVEKQLVDELVAEAVIDGKRDIQVEFRAKIMDMALGATGLHHSQTNDEGCQILGRRVMQFTRNTATLILLRCNHFFK